MVWKVLKNLRKGFKSYLEDKRIKHEWPIFVVGEGEELSYGNWCVLGTLVHIVKTSGTMVAPFLASRG